MWRIDGHGIKFANTWSWQGRKRSVISHSCDAFSCVKKGLMLYFSYVRRREASIFDGRSAMPAQDHVKWRRPENADDCGLYFWVSGGAFALHGLSSVDAGE